MAKISIVIPVHAAMDNGQYFLWRAVQSVMKQTFKDYELVIVQEGKMAENTNAGILKAKGELVKILYMDDYLAHENSLQEIVYNFKGQWLVTGCSHIATLDVLPHSYHTPSYNDEIYTGKNSIGSPSVLTFKRESGILFDTNLSWLLDCDLYKRLYNMYGLPTILDTENVVIGLHDGQTSNLMSEEAKLAEYNYIMSKYA